ncbi:sensor kinase citA, dpiB [Vibrio ishigakensis]|uniref:Sensor kinase citA, dpiB n=1 Tax=Vibrio ishigakensis TaxID=1481914 RepID=A0A0B8NTG8_9VIBR|nr:sensor kinase citA, dpiB [Vibrio ishigakensis]
MIGDNKGIRLIHPRAERLGLPMRGGDNIRALTHGESYVSFAQALSGILFAVRQRCLTTKARS